MSTKQTIFSYEGYEDMIVTLENGVLINKAKKVRFFLLAGRS